MYSKEDKIIIWLSSFDFMTYKKAYSFMNDINYITDLFDNLKDYKNDLLKIFTIQEYNELINNCNLLSIDRLISEYTKSNIVIITFMSQKYPKLLKEISTPPIILYCKGNVELLNTDCLAVVGTRRATKYGKDICARIIKDIASEGITIVSGLADGIDTVAHKSTLEVGGKTIAVLGSGLLNIYPSSNIGLANEILNNGGLIISEYKPAMQALTYHFPIRNRIIAGLSKAIAIMEATEKSGSMHTKNYALDFNREVFAVPGRVNDIYSVGCNKIIANGQARVLLDSNDILDFFGFDKNNNVLKKSIQLNYEENMIYELLKGHELHFDEIASSLSLKTSTLTTILMRLEIMGVVNKLPGNYYSIVM